MKLGLQNPTRLNAALGNPIQHFASIHIAGTNGKGSVATKIANALQLAGYRVGLFTSPHLETYRERVQLNGEKIPEATAQIILDKIRKTGVPATYFEEMTLLAFCYFAEERVDYAVVEVGLGGRLDATNILKPKLSIITSISFDHTEILGKTLEEIAREKAGIIKAGVPVLIGPTVPREVIASFTENYTQVEEEHLLYDQENTALAKRALELLDIPAKGIDIKPPCRLEMHPGVVFDVAHNPIALQKLFTALKINFPKKTFSALCAFSKTKDIMGCFKILSEHVQDLFLTGTEDGLTVKVTDMLPLAKRSGLQICTEISQLKGDILVVCGSFYHMSSVRKKLLLIN